MTVDKPTIALLLGDPCGIGPELVARLLDLDDVTLQANIFLIADRDEFLKGEIFDTLLEAQVLI